MGYWNRVIKFHERISRDYPSGEEGLQAVYFIRSFFEQRGHEKLGSNHPLDNRLHIGLDPNYLWLEQYARKLLTACSLSGFEQVAKRLGNTTEWFSAHTEMEVALKLHLEGLSISFCSVSAHPTPDLVLEMDYKKIRVEVSSLHPPEEETRIQMLVNQIIMLSRREGVVSGGYVNKVPSPRMMKTVVDNVKKAIDRVKEDHILEKVNIEGIATFYLSPPDKADQIPEGCRRSYYFILPYRRMIEERIQRKIQEKKSQTLGDNELGLLFLYTQMVNKQNITQLFERDNNIEVMLASYPKLLGLVLTVPHLGMEVASAMKSENLEKKSNRDKVFLESEAGKYQYESSIIARARESELPRRDNASPRKLFNKLE